jgi:hypothetical protein
LRRRRTAGAAAGAVLAGGAVVAPFHALLALAILHNLTPLGFVAEALGGERRRRALALLSVPFLVMPLLIASGLPGRLLAGAGFGDPEASLFAAAGPLALNLGAYVPVSLAASDWALPVFSGCVFAQLMHYAAVILLYPRLAGTARPMLLPRLRRPAAAIAVAAAALAVGFLLDFRAARQVYAVAALVHAWVEIPLLVLLVSGWPRSQKAMA